MAVEYDGERTHSDDRGEGEQDAAGETAEDDRGGVDEGDQRDDDGHVEGAEGQVIEPPFAEVDAIGSAERTGLAGQASYGQDQAGREDDQEQYAGDGQDDGAGRRHVLADVIAVHSSPKAGTSWSGPPGCSRWHQP